MKNLTIACFVLFFLGVVAFLLQLWFHLWTPDIFIKLILTDSAVFVLFIAAAFIIKEHKETEKIHNDKGLD
jgi:uncharacterized phage infection (PIP) family protein YhgE